LVVSADVPPQDGETNTQRQECENANAARAVRRQQEVVAPAADLQPANVGQANANPDNKHLWHQRPHNSDTTTIHLVPTDYVREIFSGTSSATDLTFTTRRRPIWELPSLS
jgi:hypothetical protein